jgi:hypothetical protein
MAKLLEQIRARPDCEATCRRETGKMIATIKSTQEVGDVDPSTATKAELEKFRYALKKVSGAASQLSPVTRGLLFNDLEHEFFSDELESLITNVDTTLSLIQARTQGSKPQRISKMVAAAFASSLIEKYSSFPLTLTKGGRYFRLAGLLYEVATGQRADLTRYCRAIAH